jgi:DNA-binding response OmpR family regulator
MRAPTVLVVEDDPKAAQMLQRTLTYEGYRVLSARDGREALNQARDHNPDLVVLDWNIPALDGLSVLERLRNADGTPVLMLTGRAEVADKVRALSTGADDYLVKPFDLRELELRVDALLRRTLKNNKEVKTLQAGGMRLDVSKYQVEVNGRTIQLTPVEFELLYYLMSKAGEVVSAEQLLQEVWRYYPGTGDPTVVRMQIMNLRNKIETSPKNPKHICTVYRHGYYVPD